MHAGPMVICSFALAWIDLLLLRTCGDRPCGDFTLRFVGIDLWPTLSFLLRGDSPVHMH